MKNILFLIFLNMSILFSQAPVPIIDQTRLVDWSNAGNLFNTPNKADAVLNVVDFGAIPNDDIDDYLAIESAIDSAKNIDGLKIIYFPAGTYKISSSIILQVEESNGNVVFNGNIVFQGDGENSILYFYNQLMNAASFQFLGIRKGYVSVDSNLIKGDNSINAPELPTLCNDNDWIHLSEYDSPKTTDSHHVIGQITQVLNVNTGLIKDEASKNYYSNYDLRVYKIIPLINVGIEKLKIKRVVVSQWTPPNHGYDQSNIIFKYAVNNWVKGVYFYNTFEHHIKIKYSSHILISGCYFEEANEKGDGGWGYGVSLEKSSTNCLIENNIFRKLRHAMLVQDGANCNVFSFNYSIEQQWNYLDGSGADLCMHGDYPYSNLFEENSVVKIWADAAHGDNGPYNTFLRNHTHGERVSYIWNADYTNFIGNSNSTGCDIDPSNFDEWALYDLIKNWDTKKSNNVLDIYVNYYPDGYPWQSYYSLTHSYWAMVLGGLLANQYLTHSFLNDVSYYYSSKPNFLNGYEWPSLGPYTNFDLDQYVNMLPDNWVIPAQDRCNNNGSKIYIEDPTQWPPQPPQPLEVTISGPTLLNSGQSGTYTAHPSGGSGTYTNYEWWERKDDDVPMAPAGDNGILAPPSNQWVYLTGGADKQQITISRTYNFSLKCIVTDSDGDQATSNILSVHVSGGALAKQTAEQAPVMAVPIPKKLELSGNFPNPFNPTTAIKFGLPEDGYVQINIYSIDGQKVRTLVNRQVSKGYHQVVWDGRNESGQPVSGGLYFYELKTENKRILKKMLLVK